MNFRSDIDPETVRKIKSLSPAKRKLLEIELKQREQQSEPASLTIRPRRRDGDFPLSFAQERMWILNQIDSGSPVYNSSFYLHFKGELQPEILERSFFEILLRHDVLRAVFPSVKGLPFQKIRSISSFQIPIVNLKYIPAEEQGKKIRGLAFKAAQERFSLNEGPLYRVRLICLNDKEHILFTIFHHIIFDGWSKEVFFAELAECYSAYLAGRQPDLAALPIQYADFAHWQRLKISDAPLRKQMAYWQNKLARPLSVSELPTDFPRPATQSLDGGHITVRLPALFSEQLKQLSRQESCTLFMTLLAAFKILLFRYSRQQDIVLGSPISGRNQLETEPLIGCFINTLVLRSQLSDDLSIRDLLIQVKQTAIEAYTNQDIPFEKLVAEIQPERNPNRPPLVQVLFHLRNIPKRKPKFKNLEVRQRDYESGFAKLDLLLDITNNPEGLCCVFEYNKDLFCAATISRMAKHFQKILEGFLEDLNQEIATISLVTENERIKILDLWNRTDKDYPKQCLHQRFEVQAKRTPDATAVVVEKKQFTYRELNEQANQLAHYLRKRGVCSEVMVGLCVENSFAMITGLLGILKSGGAYVPLDPTFPKDRMAFILEDTQMPVLVTQEMLLESLPANDAHIICLDADREALSWELRKNLLSGATEKNLFYVVYTSGSTGKPKGVAVEHLQLSDYMSAIEERIALPKKASYAMVSSVAADAGITVIFSALCNGGCLHILTRDFVSDPEAMADYFESHPVDCLKMVPSLFEMLLIARNPKRGLPRRLLMVGGESTRLDLVERFKTLEPKCSLMNHYGPTEATVGVSTFCFDGPLPVGATTLPIGKPIANSKLYILDGNLQPVPIGIPGELYIGGAGLARGYLNRLDLTTEKFISNPFNSAPDARLYKTGDLVRYLSDGNIEFLGRIDDQIKVRGYRIELGEIEAVLIDHPTVDQCIVMAREDTPGDKRLVAYLVKNQGGTYSTSDFRGFLKEKLPDYMIPTSFVIQTSLPRTPNGKVDRNALPPPKQIRPELAEHFVAPRTEVEKELASIWVELLGLDRVGVKDNFFELGGHSLIASQFIARVYSRMAAEIPLATLFESSTLEAFALKVEQHIKNDIYHPVAEHASQKISRRNSDTPCALSFAQERLWFLHQLESKSSLYNIANAYRLTGKLNQSALTRALQAIVARHDSLRTIFRIQNEIPVQIIEPNNTIKLQQFDLRGEHDEEIQRLIRKEAEHPFDLSCDLMLRVKLFHLHDEEHILLLIMHHIASDGWSMGVLYRELAEFYSAYTEGRPPALPELPIQYTDYAVWQRQSLQGERLEEQLCYWKRQLSGIHLLDIATDRPRPPRQTSRGARECALLSPELTSALKALSQQEGCTLFITLLTAFQILLHRYSGQDDIVVGTPIAGQTRPETENLIGVFLNTLALRSDLSGNPTFRNLLVHVREVILDAYAHKDIPFEKLLEELKPERDLSYTPLFQVFFNMLNFPDAGFDMPGVVVDSYSLPDCSAKFDLTLYVKEKENGLLIDWVYDRDLFDDLTITGMVNHFRTLLANITENPAQRLSDIKLISAADKNFRTAREKMIGSTKPFEEFTKAAVEQSIPDRFREQVRKFPNNTAVKTNNHQWTYEYLDRDSDQVMRVLIKSCGLGGARIALLVDHDAPLVAAVLGVLKAGKSYVPLDSEYPIERLDCVIADCEAIALITDDANETLAEKLACRGELQLVNLNKINNLEMDGKIDAPQVRQDEIAYILYTSGSTGHPKGVIQSHQNVLHHIRNYSNTLHIDANDKLTLLSSYGFDAAVMDIFGALLNGAALYPIKLKAEKAGELRRSLVDDEISIYHSTPTAFRYLFSGLSESDIFSEIRFVVLGGEEVYKRDVDLFKRHFSPHSIFTNGLGPSESTLALQFLLNHETLLTRNSVPVGYAVDDIEITLLDKSGNETDVYGEIAIKGAQVALGYWKKKDATKQSFLQDDQDRKLRIYRTGDMGRLLPNGAIEFAGRKDNQVKIRGFRIEPGEVEAKLLKHPAVCACIVTSHKNNEAQILVAYLTSSDRVPPSSEDLRHHLEYDLPNFMIPNRFIFLETIPRTPNGKIDHGSLPDPDALPLDVKGDYLAPRYQNEATLAEIWAEVINVDRVGIHDNFFDLGGHSLLAIQIISRVRTQLHVDLPLITLFELPTIREIAEVIEHLAQD